MMTERPTPVVAPPDDVLSRAGRALDRLVLAVAPTWGARRIARRRQFEAAQQFADLLAGRRREAMARVWEGADRDRFRGAAWMTHRLSPDSALESDLDELRHRSRDLYRTDHFAHGAVEGCVANVIGAGIVPQPHLESDTEDDELDSPIDDRHAQRVNGQLVDLFRQWCPHADRTRTQTFFDLQRLMMRTLLIDGEVFVMLADVGDADSPIPLCLEVIDADRVSTPDDALDNPNIRLGIERNAAGKVVAYHVRTTNPYDTEEVAHRWQRVPAARMIHYFEQVFPGQSRGVPWFAPCMTLLRDLKDFNEAKLVQEQIAACFAVFITTPGDPEELAAANRAEGQESGGRLEDVEPGRVTYLSEGQDVKVANPATSGDTMPAFMQWQLRGVASALNYSYELLVKDYRELSYSGGRLSLLDARMGFRGRQQGFIARVLNRIWPHIILEGILVGAVEIDAADYAAHRAWFDCCDWQAPGWPWVDPEKEVRASDQACKELLSNLHIELGTRGLDFDAVLKTSGRERLAQLRQWGNLLAEARRLKVPDEFVLAIFTGQTAKGAAAAAPASEGPADQPGKSARNAAPYAEAAA